MCPEWDYSFETFLKDMGPCPPGFSIERIDRNGNYEPRNCKWASTLEQANNRRNNHFVTIGGETLSVTAWSRKLGVPIWRVKQRMNIYGWDAVDALTAPLRARRGPRNAKGAK
jgi:hypothetical protein